MPKDTCSDINLYKDKEGEQLVKNTMFNIDKRAKLIAESSKVVELWNYFNELGLINNIYEEKGAVTK